MRRDLGCATHWALIAFSLLLSARAVAQEVDTLLLRGRVLDARTGQPIPFAMVTVTANGRHVETDTNGQFAFDGLARGRIEIRITRFGYEVLGRTLALETDMMVTFRLRAKPIRLRPITARAERAGTGSAQALFRREVAVGVVGVTGRELRKIPALLAPDVLRSLQALPGVIAKNVYSAQLHVRGGAPDQNLFLLDGARVFAPYHLFGIFGAFNPDAVDRVEFFRGAPPARYGGALSSVVRLEQKVAPLPEASFAGGVSLLGTRLTGTGGLPWANGRWMVAARRTYADVVAGIFNARFPYAFWDAQGQLTLFPAPRHRLKASFFASGDRFKLFLSGEVEQDLKSRWRNRVGSLGWSWAGAGPWSASAKLRGSFYRGTLIVGSGPAPPATTSEVGVGGVRLEARWRGQRQGLRFGLDVAGGRARLTGTGPGAFAWGDLGEDYLRPAVYAEAERWLGPVRLAPGLRVAYGTQTGKWWLDPRVAMRIHLGDDFAVTLGAGRSHQRLSTLRDGRMVLPGAPLWFLRPDAAPPSRSDGVSAEIRIWPSEHWTVRMGAYSRRLENVPRFRPVGSREVTNLAYDDGTAVGLTAMVRRHAGQLTGWLGYTLARVRMHKMESEEPYYAPWDRRHSAEFALFWRPAGHWSFSARGVYASGTPFWPPVGDIRVVRPDPGEIKPLTQDGRVPVWGTEQMRFPVHVRFDLAARYRFQWGDVELEPFASVLNVTRSPQVLYYAFIRHPPSPLQPRPPGEPFYRGPLVLTPVRALPFSIVPSIGVKIRF